MTTRCSEDLPPPPEAEGPLPANVRQVPLIIGPEVVLKIAQRQPERTVIGSLSGEPRARA
jgi:hypothetical protein